MSPRGCGFEQAGRKDCEPCSCWTDIRAWRMAGVVRPGVGRSPPTYPQRTRGRLPMDRWRQESACAARAIGTAASRPPGGGRGAGHVGPGPGARAGRGGRDRVGADRRPGRRAAPAARGPGPRRPRAPRRCPRSARLLVYGPEVGRDASRAALGRAPRGRAGVAPPQCLGALLRRGVGVAVGGRTGGERGGGDDRLDPDPGRPRPDRRPRAPRRRSSAAGRGSATGRTSWSRPVDGARRSSGRAGPGWPWSWTIEADRRRSAGGPRRCGRWSARSRATATSWRWPDEAAADGAAGPGRRGRVALARAGRTTGGGPTSARTGAVTASAPSTGAGSPSRSGSRCPGRRNVLGALAAVAACDRLDVPAAAIKQGLEEFAGVSRDFESRGSYRGVTLVDDEGDGPVGRRRGPGARPARSFGGRRLWAVYRPRRGRRRAAAGRLVARSPPPTTS